MTAPSPRYGIAEWFGEPLPASRPRRLAAETIPRSEFEDTLRRKLEPLD